MFNDCKKTPRKRKSNSKAIYLAKIFDSIANILKKREIASLKRIFWHQIYIISKEQVNLQIKVVEKISNPWGYLYISTKTGY